MNYLLAYFDPSAGSLVLQALVGGFGGIVVVGRYLWMQMRGGESTQSMMTPSEKMAVPSQYRPR